MTLKAVFKRGWDDLIQRDQFLNLRQMSMNSEIVEVEIPYKLHPIANKYEHWAVRAKRVKKEFGMIRLYLQKIPVLPVKVTLTRVAPRSWDWDNMVIAFKNIRDAVCMCYFPLAPSGKMDETDNFEWNYFQRKGAPNEYKIIIRLEKINSDVKNE